MNQESTRRPGLPVDLYVRVSRVGKREHLISPQEQELRGRGLAATKGLVCGDEVFVDLDESGGKWDRPGLQTILERVRNRQSGGIIVAWLDRLSRDSEHAQRLLREIQAEGGRVYAPDAPDDMTTPEGELMVGIQFQFAQYVRKRGREGFERAKENAIAQGIPVINRTPIGYVKGDDRRLVIDEEVAPHVRAAFEARIQGAGYTDIARTFEGLGLRTSQGSSSWVRQAVAGMISNRIYLGEVSYGGRYFNTTAHEPIVDLPTWQAAQGAVGETHRARGDYLLTGLIRCPNCGYSMVGKVNGSKRWPVLSYACRRKHAAGICPDPVSSVCPPVDEAVVEAFWSITEDISASTHPVDLSGPSKALESAERLLRHAMSPEVQEATGEDWLGMIRERRATRDAAARTLGEVRLADRTGGSTLRDLWERSSIAGRRDLLRSRLDAVYLYRTDGVKAIDVYALGHGPERPGYNGGWLRPVNGPRSGILLRQ